MKIGVDAHGGDHAPLAVLQGCRMAIDELNVEVVVFGKEEEVKGIMAQNNIAENGFYFVNTTEVIEICDDQAKAIRYKKDSSMSVGLKALKDGSVDAFVSAGSTGALLAGATLIVKRIKGVKRGALAPIIPTNGSGAMIIDCGANVEVKADYLEQFGIMGSIYMSEVLGVKNPRVGLLNIGTEDSKGTQIQIEANQIMKNTKNINYIGNVEGRDVPLGLVDVVVCDGFTGNILLKTIEGMGKMFTNNLKEMLYKSSMTKIAAVILKKELNNFKKKMDYKEAGGAMIIGVAKPVIKAHGSSDAKAFKNAIRQGKKAIDGDVIEKIIKNIAEISADNE